MQSKTAIIIDNGVAGIGTALEPDDHIRGLRQHVGDLALALVAPVGAYDRFYHNVTSVNRDSQPKNGFALSGS